MTLVDFTIGYILTKYSSYSINLHVGNDSHMIYGIVPSWFDSSKLVKKESTSDRFVERFLVVGRRENSRMSIA